MTTTTPIFLQIRALFSYFRKEAVETSPPPPLVTRLPSLPLVSCELSVSVKENPDREKSEGKQNEIRSINRTFFLVKSYIKYGEGTSPSPFSKKLELSIFLDHYRPWDYPENFGICSQLDRKSKFYFRKCLCFLNRTEQNPVTAFTPKIQVFCRSERAKWGTPWKWILTIFKHKISFLNS